MTRLFKPFTWLLFWGFSSNSSSIGLTLTSMEGARIIESIFDSRIVKQSFWSWLSLFWIVWFYGNCYALRYLPLTWKIRVRSNAKIITLHRASLIAIAAHFNLATFKGSLTGHPILNKFSCRWQPNNSLERF